MLTEAATLCPVLLVGPPPLLDPGGAARLRTPFNDVFRPLAADGLWVAEAAAWDGAHPGAPAATNAWPT